MDSSSRLQVQAATSLDAIRAIAPGWRRLTRDNDLLTAQHDWSLVSAAMLPPGERPFVPYVSDGQAIRAVLPLMSRTRAGVSHYDLLTPSIPMPADVPHTDATSLELLMSHVLRQGRPLVLPRLLQSSPVVSLLEQMTAQRRVYTVLEPAKPLLTFALDKYPLQERSTTAARVSILAASYGFSGGPNDVILQYAAPALGQVGGLYHEMLVAEAGGKALPPGKRAARRSLGDFMNDYAIQAVHHGEIRFCSLRFGGSVLAAQMFQVRNGSAWLLKAGYLDRFRTTTIPSLLLGEAVRRLQQEDVTQLVMTSELGMTDLPAHRPTPLVSVKVYSWNSRSLTALMLGQAGHLSRRLLRGQGRR